MSDYYPDYWSAIKITDGEETVYRIFGSWSGSYLYGESWRLNSGVVKVEQDPDNDNFLIFHGHSGSKYHCDKMRYGTNAYTHGILHSIIENRADGIEAEIMKDDTDWLTIAYGS